MIDGYGRTIDYLRISVTDRCNLRCLYCMPDKGVEKKNHSDILSFEELLVVSNIFIKHGIKKIRLTGGEPFVRKGVCDFIQKLSECNGLDELCVTTNGIMLYDKLKELKTTKLKSINISLDSLDKEKYFQITRGGDLEQVLKSINEAVYLGFKVKLNVVLIRNFNENEIEEFVKFTLNDDIDVRFIELMPVGEAKQFGKSKFISGDLVQKVLGYPKMITHEGECKEACDEAGISAAKYYRIKGHRGKIGIISPISSKFCANCNKVRITSDGMLKLCLHSDQEIDLKTAVRRKDYELLESKILEGVKMKPYEHGLDKSLYSTRNMNGIGG